MNWLIQFEGLPSAPPPPPPPLGGMPPPPPPPGLSNAAPGPPPAPAVDPELKNLRLPQLEIPKPKTKMKTLNWVKLPDNKVCSLESVFFNFFSLFQLLCCFTFSGGHFNGATDRLLKI